jgi:hypothetical protein
MVIGLVAILISSGMMTRIANSEQKNSTIAQLITQQAQEAVAAGVAEDTGPVTVHGKPYFILVLKNRIDPAACKVVPDSEPTKVYVDTKNYPVPDVDIARKIEVIDYVQQLQKGELQKDQLNKKIETLQKAQRRIPYFDIRDASLDAAIQLITLINIPKTVDRAIRNLIKGVGGEVAKKTFLSTMEKLRSWTFEYFSKAIDGYTNILRELVRNRSVKIEDYDIAKKILDEYQLAQNYEKSATLLAKKIYDKTDLDAATIIGDRLLNYLTLDFTDEVIARHIELDLIGQTTPQIGIPYKVAPYTKKLAEGCGKTTPVEPIGWKEYKLGALSFSVPSYWKVTDLQTLQKYKPGQPFPPPPPGVKIIEPENFYIAFSTEDYTDKRYISLEASVVAAAFKDAESGKTRIVLYTINSDEKIEEPEIKPPYPESEMVRVTHYTIRDGEKIRKVKEIEEPGIKPTRTISIGLREDLVGGFKAKIAGLPVTVCILRANEGVKFVYWSCNLFKDGKDYIFIMSSTDSTALSTFFKQFASRIRFSP